MSEHFLLTHWLLITSIPLLVKTIQCKQLRSIYLKNKTFSLNFFLHFGICIKFRTFSKKMTLIAYVFPKLPTTKDVLREMSKAPIWEDPSTGDMVNGWSIDLIIMRAPLLSWVITVKAIELQKSFWETWKFFRSFLNTLTADDKYSLISRDNWLQNFQMHLSQKQNFFSNFFLPFLNLH